MLKIKILGSASGVPTKKRYPESIVLGIKNAFYLLDCGESCSSSLVRYGIPYRKIKAVFISHMDPDHASGIPMLIQLMELTGRKLPLKIFVPEESIAGLNAALKTFLLFKEILHFRIEILPIKEGKSAYEDKNFVFFAYPNTHLKNRYGEIYPDLKAGSYSFLIKAGKKTIVYSGDIGIMQDMDTLLNEEIELLIVELAHVTPKKLFLYLESKKIKKIIVTHIHPDLDDKEKEIEEISSGYFPKEKVIIAYDGMKTEI